MWISQKQNVESINMPHRTLVKRQLRIKKDLMMIGLCLFALVGGIFVVRGFAARNVNTTEPGVVPGEKIKAGEGEPARYQLEMIAGLNYCFQTNATKEPAQLRIYSAGKEIANLKVSSANLEACYTPKNKTIQILEIRSNTSEVVIKSINIKPL
jgi:hypothetical protein